jgi:hypothetical protein
MQPQRKVCYQSMNGTFNETCNGTNWTINQSIELRSGLHYLMCRRPLKSHQVWQTLRKIGRAETSEHVDLLQRIHEYRLKAEFTLVQVIDTLGRRKRVEPVVGLLVAAAFTRSLRFLTLCVPTQTGLS